MIQGKTVISAIITQLKDLVPQQLIKKNLQNLRPELLEPKLFKPNTYRLASVKKLPVSSKCFLNLPLISFASFGQNLPKQKRV